MSVFKCKMCGGELNVNENSSITQCEYCGSSQTISTTENEELMNLFNKANNLRRRCEFDKAEILYERIINENDSDPEAYWGALLCKYGIEYVEDPKTNNRIPTCHRASYESILANEYYKNAIEKADVLQRSIYEKEANEINRLQKEILLISEKEEPYDVFICYKETDENGERTPDSVIANDIYHELTEEGFKVFYSAITLENRLGEEYEPIIFAGINSAKVMLVIGTKPEYFNAVWVKNEWSRYIKITKTDRSKKLIPCYKDMDAYDLPEEFAHLQAQNMAKIGFMTDIIRGLEKLLDKNTSNINDDDSNPLLKRAFIFLEDGDFYKANEYSERVLDQDPENAEAYLVKLMVDYEVKKKYELSKVKENFENNNNYKRILKYGSKDLIDEINSYLLNVKKQSSHNSDFTTRFKMYLKDEINNFKETVNNEFFNNDKIKVNNDYDKYDNDCNVDSVIFNSSNDNYGSNENIESDKNKIIEEYNNIPSPEEIKERIKNKNNIKKLLYVGIVFIFFYWPVAVVIFIIRNAKINAAIKEEQARYAQIRKRYYEIMKQ